MNEIMKHPKLKGLRPWILLSETDEWLYNKYNFYKRTNPEIQIRLFYSKYQENIKKFTNRLKTQTNIF